MSLINCPTPAVTYRGRILCLGGKVTVGRTRRTYDQNTSEYLIDLETGCWVWQRSTSFQGYGQVWYKGRLHRAHRVFYELHRGPIPEGLQIDHTCGNRLCVNPDHLEPVTPIENTRRAMRREP
jgi:HNH endonuclease